MFPFDDVIMLTSNNKICGEGGEGYSGDDDGETADDDDDEVICILFPVDISKST